MRKKRKAPKRRKSIAKARRGHVMRKRKGSKPVRRRRTGKQSIPQDTMPQRSKRFSGRGIPGVKICHDEKGRKYAIAVPPCSPDEFIRFSNEKFEIAERFASWSSCTVGQIALKMRNKYIEEPASSPVVCILQVAGHKVIMHLVNVSDQSRRVSSDDFKYDKSHLEHETEKQGILIQIREIRMRILGRTLELPPYAKTHVVASHDVSDWKDLDPAALREGALIVNCLVSVDRKKYSLYAPFSCAEE